MLNLTKLNVKIKSKIKMKYVLILSISSGNRENRTRKLIKNEAPIMAYH